MIKNKIYFIILLFLILGGCSQVDLSKVNLSDVSEEDINKVIVCNEPYIRHALECCLDQNNNKICDLDESEKNNHSNNSSQTEKITTDLEIVQIYANGTSDGEVNNDDEVILILRLVSGSSPIKLDDLSIKLNSNGNSQLINYGNSITQEIFSIKYISNKGSSKNPGYISNGDLVQVIFKNKYDIKENNKAELELLTKNGAIKPAHITIPTAMTKETTYLFP